MDKWAEIRRRVLVDGLGKRTARREYGIHYETKRRSGLGGGLCPGAGQKPPRPAAVLTLTVPAAACDPPPTRRCWRSPTATTGPRSASASRRSIPSSSASSPVTVKPRSS
jgi:hypothetical protein